MALLPLTGCQYNQTCSYPVVDATGTVFTLTQTVPLAPAVVGGGETAFGDAVPDSYLKMLQQQAATNKTTPPQVAVEVAGTIHDDGLCGVTGLSLQAGLVTTSVLRDALPHDEPLVIEQMTLRTLFNVLEHGVAGPTCAIDSSSGLLVEVSGLQYTVNLNLPPELTTQLGAATIRTVEGQRVVSLSMGGRSYARSFSSTAGDTVDDADDNTELFAVALPESLAQGTGGFYDLLDAYTQGGAAVYQPTSLWTFEALDGFLAAKGAQGPVDLAVDQRITIQNCASP